FWRHARMHPIQERRAFPRKTLDAIQREVAAQEQRHRGQVVFVVEAELSSAQLWHGLSSRARAPQVFAAHGVWNTEENNGVLVYLLLADPRGETMLGTGPTHGGPPRARPCSTHPPPAPRQRGHSRLRQHCPIYRLDPDP